MGEAASGRFVRGSGEASFICAGAAEDFGMDPIQSGAAPLDANLVDEPGSISMYARAPNLPSIIRRGAAVTHA